MCWPCSSWASCSRPNHFGGASKIANGGVVLSLLGLMVFGPGEGFG